ncbi:MAG TPA: hypothetical protein VN943_17705 [Candidatus Acidoferrum sp.]|nr:hypothetical protein [Candidatus Acidoferrum sp.]
MRNALNTFSERGEARREAEPSSGVVESGIKKVRSRELGPCRLLKYVFVSTRVLFRFVLPAVASLPLGFIGLALAAQNEPAIPGPVLMLLSPGLKLAELIAPGAHGSLGATFGWFLRVGIVGNAAYYFAIFVLFAYLLTRRSAAR